MYYGDINEDGLWTDTRHYSYLSKWPRQNNTIGDDKFDQGWLPYTAVLELQVFNFI